MELNEKEKDIIKMIGKGYTNKEIGEKLHLKKTSVAIYIYNLCRIYEAKNRIDLFNKFKGE